MIFPAFIQLTRRLPSFFLLLMLRRFAEKLFNHERLVLDEVSMSQSLDTFFNLKLGYTTVTSAAECLHV